MSRLMEITVKLIPIYGSGGMAGRLPNLTRGLKEFGYEKVLREEPSVYELVDVLIRLNNDPAVLANIKKPIARMLDKITEVRDLARGQLLARRLSELDQTLYRLEDLFEDLERELSW